MTEWRDTGGEGGGCVKNEDIILYLLSGMTCNASINNTVLRQKFFTIIHPGPY